MAVALALTIGSELIYQDKSLSDNLYIFSRLALWLGIFYYASPAFDLYRRAVKRMEDEDKEKGDNSVDG